MSKKRQLSLNWSVEKRLCWGNSEPQKAMVIRLIEGVGQDASVQSEIVIPVRELSVPVDVMPAQITAAFKEIMRPENADRYFGPDPQPISLAAAASGD